MLEEPSLLMLPWAPSAAANDERCVITAAVGRRYLGFARRSNPSFFLPLHWLFPSPVEVFETEDESLLLQLRSGWLAGGSRDVLDADSRLVGRLRDDFLLDQLGEPFAILRREGSGEGSRFVAPDGTELGSVSDGREGTYLTFGPWIHGNPFAKMMLLAAVLRAKR